MPNLQHRTFLITGGASGIGLETARLLRQHGATVALWDVNEAGLKQAESALGAETAVLDITQPAQVQQAVQQLITQFGALHGVVHCAGILRSGTLQQIPLEQQIKVVEINLTGSVILLNATLPHLAQTHGSFVLLSSISAFYGPPEFATYGASKAGVLSLAQSMRLEMEHSGVHIGVVCPFFVATPMLADAANARMFKRFGVAHTPQEVAQAILHGIHRRKFMIWPSLNPFFFHWLSHMAYPLSHWFMKLFWKSR